MQLQQLLPLLPTMRHPRVLGDDDGDGVVVVVVDVQPPTTAVARVLECRLP